jgi:hypothetical protein
LQKKIEKNKFFDRKKLSVAFDRAMLIVHENDIFPRLSFPVLEIHEFKAKSTGQ